MQEVIQLFCESNILHENSGLDQYFIESHILSNNTNIKAIERGIQLLKESDTHFPYVISIFKG